MKTRLLSSILVCVGFAATALADDEAAHHWAFQPLCDAQPPAVADSGNSDACRNAIDRFILRRLEDRNLSPSEPASPRELIRRLSFDLTGLPPQPDDVETFASDSSDTAYERLVDRLLASPRYGERWGRHWLDVARFAESYGFEHDFDIASAYHYRDFVIRALNLDMAYDRFVRLQLAGDELEPDNPLAWMATGFLTAGVHNFAYAPIQVEKERYDELDDMVSTMGTAMLGLTLGCARCHEHKYDPISQEEYYRLAAMFSTTVRTEVEFDFDPEHYRKLKAAFDREHAPLVEALERFDREELPSRFEAWISRGPEPPRRPDWLVPPMVETQSEGGATFTKRNDGSYLLSGENPINDDHRFVAETPFGGIRSIRLQALTDHSLPKNGPGRSSNGNFVLTGFRVKATPLAGEGESVVARWRSAKETFHQNGLAVAGAIDENDKTGWAIDPRAGEDHAAVFELEEPLGFEGGTRLEIELEYHYGSNHVIGRPRISISTMATPPGFLAEELLQEVFVHVPELLKRSPEQLTKPEKAKLVQFYRHIDPERARLNKFVEEHLQRAPRQDVRKVLAASEGLKPHRIYSPLPAFYETTYLLEGGDTKRKGAAMTAGFPSTLVTASASPDRWRVEARAGAKSSYRRTGLARWITDTEAGAGVLLARVIVNRLWQHHFGRGIVETPSDFGRQGEPPTHPELLDWLARELIRVGWRLKPIHRLIVTSATYRRSQRASDDAWRADPRNELLARFSFRRIEAEAIRDAMLEVAGLLDTAMYGPGTLDPSMRRRSVYFRVKRSQPIPILLLFDAPDGLVSIDRRPISTVAPQALALMNNELVRGYARAFASRLMSGSDSGARASEAVIDAAYRLALGRPPTNEESEDARMLLGTDGKVTKEAVTDLCQTLFCLNEFLYVE